MVENPAPTSIIFLGLKWRSCSSIFPHPRLLNSYGLSISQNTEKTYLEEEIQAVEIVGMKSSNLRT
jgi:hypothetical protein